MRKKKSELDCFCIRNVTFLLWYRFNDTLRIPVKPLLVNITNKRAHLSALKTYEIECTSSGSRPEAVITWWKGNHQVKHMARNVSITFLNLRLPCSISTIFTRQIRVILDSEFFVVCRSEHYEKYAELRTHHGGWWEISDVSSRESSCTW